jgi:hypothetical protein
MPCRPLIWREDPPHPGAAARTSRSGTKPLALLDLGEEERGGHPWRCARSRYTSQLRRQRFGGSLRVVGEWATRRRRGEQAEGTVAERLSPARVIARAMLSCRSRPTTAEAVMMAAIEAPRPKLATARVLVNHSTAWCVAERRRRCGAGWQKLRLSTVATFGRGISGDPAAVTAALTETWSTGETEGNVTRLKLLRRQLYSRRLDLLPRTIDRSHMISASCTEIEPEPFFHADSDPGCVAGEDRCLRHGHDGKFGR